jgi:hypothetical protein
VDWDRRLYRLGFGFFAIGINGGGVDDVSGFDMHDRRDVAIDGFEILHFEVVMNDVLGLGGE